MVAARLLYALNRVRRCAYLHAGVVAVLVLQRPLRLAAPTNVRGNGWNIGDAAVGGKAKTSESCGPGVDRSAGSKLHCRMATNTDHIARGAGKCGDPHGFRGQAGGLAGKFSWNFLCAYVYRRSRRRFGAGGVSAAAR